MSEKHVTGTAENMLQDKDLQTPMLAEGSLLGQRSATLWVSRFGTVVSLVGALFCLLLFAQLEAPQFLALAICSFLALVGMVWANRQLSLGQVDKAALGTFYSMVFILACGELLLAQITLLISVFSLTLLLGLGGVMFSRKKSTLWGGVAALGLWFVLVEWLEPISRYVIGFFDSSNLVIEIFMISFLLVGVFVFRLILAIRYATIRMRLLTAFAFVALLPGLIIASLAVFMGFSSIQDQGTEDIEFVIVVRERALDVWLDDLELELLAEISAQQALERSLLEVDPASGSFESISRELSSRFESSLDRRQVFEIFSLVDLQGRVVFSSDPTARGLLYPRSILLSTEPGSISTYMLDYSSFLRGPALVVAYPILSLQGEVLGQLVGETSLDRLYEIVEDPLGLKETSEIYLVAGDVERQYRLMSDLRSGALISAVTSDGVKAMLTALAAQSLPAKTSDIIGTYENYAGTSVLGVYHWIPRLQVVMVAETQLAEVYYTTQLMVFSNVGMTILAVALAMFAAFFVIRSIADPLTNLSLIASWITAGDLSHMATIEHKDEVGILAFAFNQMTMRLRTVIGNLEEKVAERTADLQSRSAQLEAAAHVSRQAASVRDVEQLFEVVVKQTSEQFGFYNVSIYLVDDNKHYAVLAAASSEGGKRLMETSYRLKISEEGMVGYAAASGKANLALEVDKDSHYLASSYLPLTRSEMALPLLVRDEIIGVLDVQSKDPLAFTSEDVTYLQTMADQVAMAIENARLLNNAEKQLTQISRLLQSQSLGGWQKLATERPVWGYVYDGTIVKSHTAESVPDFDAQFTLPLRSRDALIGQLKVSLSDRVPTSEDMYLARTVVEQASLALESARLFRETQTTLEEVGILYRGSQAIGAAQTSAEVLGAFTDHLVSPGIDRCVLAILESAATVENSSVRIEASWDPDVKHPSVLGARWSVGQLPLIARMPTEIMVFSDVKTSEDMDDISRHVFLNVLGIQAFLLVPFVATGKVLGWLLVESLNSTYDFSEQEIRLYRSLADQAAVVLQSIRLLNDVTRRAEREQRIAEIMAQVRSSTNIESILQTSVRELGRTLRAADSLIYLKLGDEQRTVQTGPLSALPEESAIADDVDTGGDADEVVV